MIPGFDEATGFDEVVYTDVNARTEDLTAEHGTQDDLVAYWNKGDRATKEEEEALRALLEHRAMEIEETGVVLDALPDLNDEEMNDDGELVDKPCEGDEDACVTEDEFASVSE